LYLAKKVNDYFEEAKAIIDTKIFDYSGMYGDGENSVTFHWIPSSIFNTSRLETLKLETYYSVTCCVGRINGDVIFRYQGRNEAMCQLKGMGVFISNSVFSYEKVCKGVRIYEEVVVGTYLQYGFFKDISVAKTWLEKNLKKACCVGRINGDVIFRYQGRNEAMRQLKGMGVFISNSAFSYGKVFKGVRICEEVVVGTYL